MLFIDLPQPAEAIQNETSSAGCHTAGIKTFSGTGMKRGRIQSHPLGPIIARSWVPLPPDASLHEGLHALECAESQQSTRVLTQSSHWCISHVRQCGLSWLSLAM